MEIDISQKVNRMFKFGFVGIVGIAIVVSFGVWWWQQHNYITVHNASISGSYVNAGIKTAGTVKEILVENGTTVQAGQPLAKIKVKVSPEEIQKLEKAFEDAKIRYNELITRPTVVNAPTMTSSGGDTSGARAALEKAAVNKERMDKLFAIGAISAVQHNKAVQAYEAAQAALDEAQAAPSVVDTAPIVSSAVSQQLIKVAQIQLQQAELALAASKKDDQETQVLAPVDGVVNFTEVKTGDEVSAGQTLFTIGDANNIWVEMQVPETYIDKVQLGQFVKYSVSDFPGEIFQGTVFDIVKNDAQSDAQNTEVQDIPVKISLPSDGDYVFKQGMKVLIKLRKN